MTLWPQYFLFLRTPCGLLSTLIFSLAFLAVTNLSLSNIVFAERPDETSEWAETVHKFQDSNSDFFRLATGEGKDIELRYTMASSRAFKDSDVGAKVDTQQLLFSAEIPIPQSTDFFWRIVPTYDVGFYNFKNVDVDSTPLESQQLHRIELGQGIGYFINPDLLATVLVRPELVSNLSGVDSDHFQLYSELIFVYRYLPNIQLIAGVISSELFDEVAIFPVAGLRVIALNGRLHLKLTPPVELRVGYSLANDWQLYAGFWLSGDEYRVEFGQQEFQIQTQDRQVGIGIAYWLDEHISLRLESGAYLNSTFQFELVETSLPSDDLDPAFYSMLSLAYGY